MYIKKPYDPGYSVIPPNYRGTAFDNIDLPPCPPEPPCPPKRECDCCGPLPKHDCPPCGEHGHHKPPCPPPCPPKRECDCCGPLPKHDCPPCGEHGHHKPPCPPPCPPKQECDCCGPLPKHDCPPHRKGCFNILPAFSSLFKNRDMLILAGLLFLLMQNNSADCKPDGTLLLLALVLLL